MDITKKISLIYYAEKINIYKYLIFFLFFYKEHVYFQNKQTDKQQQQKHIHCQHTFFNIFNEKKKYFF